MRSIPFGPNAPSGLPALITIQRGLTTLRFTTADRDLTKRPRRNCSKQTKVTEVLLLFWMGMGGAALGAATFFGLPALFLATDTEHSDIFPMVLFFPGAFILMFDAVIWLAWLMLKVFFT